jgi:purine-binding chemotaxis protein CheW
MHLRKKPMPTDIRGRKMAEKERKVEKLQYLTFFLSKDLFGISILKVREIMEFGGITHLPMMPDFIKGVINLRGKAVPVVDLSLRLGFGKGELTKKTCIVIVEINSEDGQIEVGLMVDSVDEVLELGMDQIEPPPRFGSTIRTDFIQGMGKIETKFVILLESDNILSLEEISLLEGAGKEGQEIIQPE